jgi:hypothetical protein
VVQPGSAAMPARRARQTIWLPPEMPTASCSGARLRPALGQAARAQRPKAVPHFNNGDRTHAAAVGLG